MIKKLLIYSLGTVVFYLLITILFDGHEYIFPIFMISAFFFSFFLTKKKMLYSLSLLTFIWFIHFFREESIISNVIIYFIFTPLTFYLGYYLKKKHFLYKILYPILLLLVGVYGFSNFWHYTTNFNARQIINSPKMYLNNSLGNLMRLDTIRDKIIVLDFWTTNCGVCFEKFPKYEKLYLKYKANPKILMYAINIPVRRDTIGFAKRLIEKYDYQFPILYSDSDSVPKKLGFNTYPHLVILKNAKIRYNGYPVLDDKLYVDNLEDELELLLKE